MKRQKDIKSFFKTTRNENEPIPLPCPSSIPRDDSPMEPASLPPSSSFIPIDDSPMEPTSLPPSLSSIPRDDDSPMEPTSLPPSSSSIPRDDIPIEPTARKISRTRIDLELTNLPSDPGLRPPISDYDPNDRDLVRRIYLQRGPCQPELSYPQTKTTEKEKSRAFVPSLFKKYKSWLEYSIHSDAVFCLPCYLFRPESRAGGSFDTFVSRGYKNWKNTKRIGGHVGDHNSSHNQACRKAETLMKKNRHIDTFVAKQSEQEKVEYRMRLNASLDTTRFLLRQGLAFRGRDESKKALNRGNFLETLKFLADHNETINNVVLDNAPKNHKLTSGEIQKELVNACAMETVNAIMKDLGDEQFAILLDEARDTSVKEQMAVVLRFVDKKGCVIERFVGVIHVPDTTAISLKASLEQFFGEHKLSISRLRGQGYDGASNMQGKLNGLKTLIQKENKFAFYVHCFAHQLQLALVHVAKDIEEIALFFTNVTNVVNVIGASCKRRDNLRTKEANRIRSLLATGEISSGRGLNQETSLKRPGETRWGSHYGTLINLIYVFPSLIEVLEDVIEDGSSDQKAEAGLLVDLMLSFEFIFTLHLMKSILEITNDLSKALQRQDQDIVNAMTLVRISKERLQKMRDSGWDSLFGVVSSFCTKNNITIPRMDDTFLPRGRRKRKAQVITNRHHYQAELFYLCVDKQSAELNSRFNEVNTELLLCMASLNPRDSFSAFDNSKIVRLAEFYSADFSEQERMVLQNQLDIYEMDVKSNDDFAGLNGISCLAQKMVATRKDIVYNLVFRLIKLVLILPVATATVERAFSAMNIIKSRLRNRMGDEWMNDSLITYIEKDVFDNISNEAIMTRFQHMEPRRREL